MKNLIILGGLAVAGAVALAKSEKGQELLAAIDEKLAEKAKEADERNAESLAKIEEALRNAGDSAVKRLADVLGISEDVLRASQAADAKDKTHPYADEPTTERDDLTH
jgi:hypothetical protein